MFYPAGHARNRMPNAFIDTIARGYAFVCNNNNSNTVAMESRQRGTDEMDFISWHRPWPIR